MSYKQIETSREIRLWIGQVIIPAATVVGVVMAKPEARKAVVSKFNNIKTSITNKIKRRKFTEVES